LTDFVTSRNPLFAVSRFALPAFWWMHAMTALWLIVTLMLFVLERCHHNHASTRTTQLYDRRYDEMSLDAVERILI
jgi:hypothetical protein